MRIAVLIMAMLLVVEYSKAVTPVDKYPYVMVLDGDSTVDIPDSLFYKISRKVIFPVNKYVIPENSEFRREITEELMPYMNSISYRLHSIIVRGAASPEGPYRWNKFLSEHRMKALLELINENSTLPIDEKLRTVEVPEDYIYLLRVMKEKDDPDYFRVKAIVDKWFEADIHVLKDCLKKFDGGKVWRRLFKTYYPEMRAARVVLVFKRYEMPTAKVAEIVPPGISTPEPTMLEMRRRPRRELLSVKTNLLLDLAYMPGYDRWCPIPNVAVEYYPLHGHFTFGASIDFPWWQHYNDHKYFQLRNYQLETRYYFKSGDVDERGYDDGPAFRGWYLQAYAHAALYGLSFDADRGWEGEGIGGGLGIGYVMPLSRNGHWRLEFGAQFGFFWTKYDPYQYDCPVENCAHDHLYYYKWTEDADLFRKRQHRFTWLGPTRIGVTLSYDLLYRKRFRGGTSLKNWEWW